MTELRHERSNRATAGTLRRTVVVVDLNYSPVGATTIDAEIWSAPPVAFRAYERSVLVGDGDAVWQAARTDLLTWTIKTKSGFGVVAADGAHGAVRAGLDYTLVAQLGPLRIREPVRVVVVIDQATRCGFAYGTRHGHPVSGEEAFIVTRRNDGSVWLTLRSLTRPSNGRWRTLFPLILVAQRWYRFRYMRALRDR